MLVLGLGDMAFALDRARQRPTSYFIVPFIAVGAGFVIATTVRTAIIFASVPRRLPSTAAALNQTSLLVGSQLGVAVVTTLVALFSTNQMRDQVASAPPAQQADMLAQFTTFLQALGTASFGAISDVPGRRLGGPVRCRLRGRPGGGRGTDGSHHRDRRRRCVAGHGSLGGRGVGLGAP